MKNVRVFDKGNGSFSVRWAIIGEHGAAEFHGTFYRKGAMPFRGEIVTPKYDFHAYGFECHSRKQFEYSSSKDKPDHESCYLLNGPCWHDGTSLHASEWASGQYRLSNKNIFNKLKLMYYDWFVEASQ